MHRSSADGGRAGTATGGDHILVATGLTRSYVQGARTVAALRGVDLAVAAGEFVAICGRSGSGKSTLLHLLGGLDRPDAGEVVLAGQELSSLPDQELARMRRRSLGFVLQFFNLLPTLTAVENAAFPLLVDGASDAQERARAALGAVGLRDRADHRPNQLSGGEQQRVALARALAADPAVILADEPTGNLDTATSDEIAALLREASRSGQTIVMVTHDESVAAHADRILTLSDGRLLSGREG